MERGINRMSEYNENTHYSAAMKGSLSRYNTALEIRAQLEKDIEKTNQEIDRVYIELGKVAYEVQMYGSGNTLDAKHNHFMERLINLKDGLLHDVKEELRLINLVIGSLQQDLRDTHQSK